MVSRHNRITRDLNSVTMRRLVTGHSMVTVTVTNLGYRIIRFAKLVNPHYVIVTVKISIGLLVVIRDPIRYHDVADETKEVL